MKNDQKQWRKKKLNLSKKQLTSSVKENQKFTHGSKAEVRFNDKIWCVFLMVVVSILLHAEFGRNDHREDAPHFKM